MLTTLLQLAVLLGASLVSAETEACPEGWFGSNCMYMCHCSNMECDVNGECIPPSKCDSNFFGPSCQYVDLVIIPGATTIPPELNSVPCRQNSSLTAVSVTLLYPSPFLWVRIATSESEFLLNFTVKINDEDICDNERRFKLNDSLVDVTCDTSVFLSKLELEGAIAPYVCSIRISGGRNVALKQETWQTSSLFPDYMEDGESHRAVDGSAVYSMYHKTCAFSNKEPEGPSWYLVFNRPQILYSVYIAGAPTSYRSHLYGFILEIFDQYRNITERYVDPNTLSSTFNVSLRSRDLVTSLRIFRPPYFGASEVTLSLCEVMTFGETICPDGEYGVQCKGNCSCQEAEMCNLVTGACAPGCEAGLYGFNCTFNCSKLCYQGKCQQRFGGCYHCLPGRSGEGCQRECDRGFYGLDCKMRCSPNCLDICNAENGGCTCSENFQEPLCRDCSPGFYSDNCTHNCPVNCEKQRCDKRTGNCMSCLGGRVGPHCEDCPNSYYGSLCYTKCSMFCSNGTCDRHNGSCPACTEGYSGPQCVVAPTSNMAWGVLLMLPAISLLVGLCTIFLLRRKIATANSDPEISMDSSGESSSVDTDMPTDNV